MRLVDTSAWVEWLIGSTTGLLVAAALPAEGNGLCRRSSNWNLRSGWPEKSARTRPILTQAAFVKRLHIALPRLRDGEQARYRPDSVGEAYIKAIRHDPKAIERALAARADGGGVIRRRLVNAADKRMSQKRRVNTELSVPPLLANRPV